MTSNSSNSSNSSIASTLSNTNENNETDNLLNENVVEGVAVSTAVSKTLTELAYIKEHNSMKYLVVLCQGLKK